jgi:hypothetical protein
VFTEEGAAGAARPKLHSGGQALHGHRVDAQEVAHKHHTLNALTPEEKRSKYNITYKIN